MSDVLARLLLSAPIAGRNICDSLDCLWKTIWKTQLIHLDVERAQFISWLDQLCCTISRWIGLPTEIKDNERFLSLSETATECRVRRTADAVKLKLRTPKMLYTIKLDVAAAEDLLKKVKCPVREV